MNVKMRGTAQGSGSSHYPPAHTHTPSRGSLPREEPLAQWELLSSDLTGAYLDALKSPAYLTFTELVSSQPSPAHTQGPQHSPHPATQAMAGAGAGVGRRGARWPSPPRPTLCHLEEGGTLKLINRTLFAGLQSTRRSPANTPSTAFVENPVFGGQSHQTPLSCRSRPGIPSAQRVLSISFRDTDASAPMTN